MKSHPQPANEQVSDAQNQLEGDKSFRFEIPSVRTTKRKKGGKKKTDKKQDRTSCSIELKPRL